MDFPITRAELKALGSKSNQELFNEQIEEKIQKTMEYIVNKVIEHAKFGHTHYKYKINQDNLIVKQTTRGTLHTDSQLQRYILPDFLEMLQIKFPECDILVKTYIYIGWA